MRYWRGTIGKATGRQGGGCPPPNDEIVDFRETLESAIDTLEGSIQIGSVAALSIWKRMHLYIRKGVS